jgi:hypothetical protein
MSYEQARAKINAAIWQAFAQSGVDFSSISHDQQVILVNKITDNILVSTDLVINEENPIPATAFDDIEADEMILWQGRPFLSLVETYVITSDRLKIVHGLVGRDVEIFELIRLQDIDYKQHIAERMFNIGDITLRGADASRDTIVLRNIKDPEKVYETIRKAWMAARKRHGLQFREFL